MDVELFTEIIELKANIFTTYSAFLWLRIRKNINGIGSTAKLSDEKKKIMNLT